MDDIVDQPAGKGAACLQNRQTILNPKQRSVARNLAESEPGTTGIAATACENLAERRFERRKTVARRLLLNMVARFDSDM